MTRNKAIILLSSVWLIAFIAMILTWVSEQPKQIDIVTAFATENYLSTSGEVYVYADYGNKYLSEDDKKEIITKLAKSIGINNDIEFQSKREGENGEFTSTVSYSVYNNYSSTDIRIVTIENQELEGVVYLEQYILIQISIDNSVESAVYYQDKLEKTLDDMKIESDVMLSLKGSVQGTLSNDKKNEICENIIEQLDGELVIGGENDEIYTVYAYTENIDKYVLSGSVKSNINIMVTYDRENDISWIQVGVPIIE